MIHKVATKRDGGKNIIINKEYLLWCYNLYHKINILSLIFLYFQY